MLVFNWGLLLTFFLLRFPRLNKGSLKKSSTTSAFALKGVILKLIIRNFRVLSESSFLEFSKSLLLEFSYRVRFLLELVLFRFLLEFY